MSEVAKLDTLPPAVHAVDPMVSMIERLASDPQSDLTKLEKMLEMKERIDAKNAERSFDDAMAEAKGKIGPIIKTGVVDYESRNAPNGRTYFKHETLEDIASKVDPVLSSLGLSYRFCSTQTERGALTVTCIVTGHGHRQEVSLEGAPDSSGSKNAYQAVGSAVTYLQRYTLKLALGLSAAKDDDANTSPKPATISPDQIIILRDQTENAGADVEKLLRAYGAQSLEQFPSEKFDHAMKALGKKINAAR